MDEKYGTHYHENFKKFLIMVQDNDLTVDGAMTDPKGDRSKAPHDQADPDMFVHVVERRDDGIVVCGAKCHQTGSVNSHWHIFMPTIAMGEADKDYAVCFACPTDAEGLYMIYGRQSCDTRKMEEGCIDVGNAKFGGQEALVVLDHVFIPNEYIFLNGEYMTVKVQTPCMITCIKELNQPRYLSVGGAFEAYSKPLTTMTYETLKDHPLIDATTIGLKGSPTNILTSFTPPQKGAGMMLEGAGKETTDKLAGILAAKHII